jgi:hypothetical protein
LDIPAEIRLILRLQEQDLDRFTLSSLSAAAKAQAKQFDLEIQSIEPATDCRL